MLPQHASLSRLCFPARASPSPCRARPTQDENLRADSRSFFALFAVGALGAPKGTFLLPHTFGPDARPRVVRSYRAVATEPLTWFVRAQGRTGICQEF